MFFKNILKPQTYEDQSNVSVLFFVYLVYTFWAVLVHNKYLFLVLNSLKFEPGQETWRKSVSTTDCWNPHAPLFFPFWVVFVCLFVPCR